MIRVLALDVSMTSTGFCVASETGVEVLASVQTTPRDGSWIDRANIIIDAVHGAIGPFPLDLMVYEKPIAYGRGGKAVELHMLTGHVVATLNGMLTTPTYDVPPSTIKKYFTGKGNAKKPDMIDEAKRRGFAVTNSDEADALALVLYVLDAPKGA